MTEKVEMTGGENPVSGQARLVWAAGAKLGEGATWDDHANRLWWVDIRGRRLHCMDEADSDRRSWDLSQEPGCGALTDEPAGILLGFTGKALMYRALA